MPVPVQEIFRAINFVYDNAERFNIDLNNAFITGDSAGGHYAGLVLSIIADEELEKLYEVEKCRMTFKGVAFTCAAFYPNSIANFPVHLAKTYVGLFYGGAKKFENHKFYKSVDIINNKVEKFPPMFINSCFNDMLKGDTNRFVECLDRKKNPVQPRFSDVGRVRKQNGTRLRRFVSRRLGRKQKTIDKTCGFFKEQMNK
ncbi:MAG: alpha/beta hydrolase [Clostridiales bacterium]|nr:MAG: alpha/beta hydrolase [Clostridiales bacterium]